MTETTLRLTNSEMKTWRRCRRQWWLGYHRGLQRRETEFNKPLSVGSRLHDVLAWYYQPGLARDPEDAMRVLREGVEVDVRNHPDHEEDIRKEADLVDAMLEGYFQWLEEEGHDSQIEIIAPEAEMEVALEVVDGATILSKIDARIRDVETGKVGALEHKSVQSLKDPIRRLQVDTQLLTEHLVEYLTQLAEPGTVSGLDATELEAMKMPELRKLATDLDLAPGGRKKADYVAALSAPAANPAEFVLYNMLRKVKRTPSAKPPFYGREEVRHNVEELRSHYRHVAQQAREIIRARQILDEDPDSHHEIAYPNPTNDCTWDCAFKDVCLGGMIDDGSDFEAALEEHFVVGDPLERYRDEVGLTPRAASAETVESAQ